MLCFKRKPIVANLQKLRNFDFNYIIFVRKICYWITIYKKYYWNFSLIRGKTCYFNCHNPILAGHFLFLRYPFFKLIKLICRGNLNLTINI